MTVLNEGSHKLGVT